MPVEMTLVTVADPLVTTAEANVAAALLAADTCDPRFSVVTLVSPVSASVDALAGAAATSDAPAKTTAVEHVAASVRRTPLLLIFIASQFLSPVTHWSQDTPFSPCGLGVGELLHLGPSSVRLGLREMAPDREIRSDSDASFPQSGALTAPPRKSTRSGTPTASG